MHFCTLVGSSDVLFLNTDHDQVQYNDIKEKHSLLATVIPIYKS